MKLLLLSERFAVCRLAPYLDVPDWAWQGKQLASVTFTDDELSIVCPDQYVPSDILCEKGWIAFKVQGPLDFSLTGVLSSLLQPLAANQVSIFALSTFDTDYILLKETQLEKARTLLEQAGHLIES